MYDLLPALKRSTINTYGTGARVWFLQYPSFLVVVIGIILRSTFPKQRRVQQYSNQNCRRPLRQVGITLFWLTYCRFGGGFRKCKPRAEIFWRCRMCFCSAWLHIFTWGCVLVGARVLHRMGVRGGDSIIKAGCKKIRPCFRQSLGMTFNQQYVRLNTTPLACSG